MNVRNSVSHPLAHVLRSPALFLKLVGNCLRKRFYEIAISATFFTVMVSTPNEWSDLDQPGDMDPVVGGKIFTSLHELLLRISPRSSAWNRLNAMAERIGYYWGRMKRSRDPNFWWGLANKYHHSKASNSEKTTYECDSMLGNPKPVDCSHLQYSAFPIGVDESIQVQPGEPKFLHSESCSIGISSRIPVTLTWERIKAAVNDLVEICVNDPRITAVGGRAYYSDRKPGSIGGNGELKRQEQNVTGSGGLPPGANITLFQQVEQVPAGTSADDELNSCTWQEAVQRQDVRQCEHHVYARPTG